jgi:hypothetical protein
MKESREEEERKKEGEGTDGKDETTRGKTRGGVFIGVIVKAARPASAHRRLNRMFGNWYYRSRKIL